MALLTFSPPRAPSPSSQKTTDYAVNKADFGDSHVQRAPDGINNVRVTWALTFEHLTATQAAEIEAFMNAHAGYKAFYYTAPYDVQRKYTSGPVIRAYPESGVLETLTVTLTEVFDP